MARVTFSTRVWRVQGDVSLSPGVLQWSSPSGASRVGRSWVTSGRRTSACFKPSILRGEISNVACWFLSLRCISRCLKLLGSSCARSIFWKQSSRSATQQKPFSLFSCHRVCSFPPKVLRCLRSDLRCNDKMNEWIIAITWSHLGCHPDYCLQ